MTYDANQVKKRILEITEQLSQVEIQYTKQQNFQRAIELALEEVQEFKQLYEKFIQDVSHLQIFKEVIAEPLDKRMVQVLDDLTYLIKKNYTEEERKNMPTDVYNQIKASQERRMKILKKVAKKYLVKPNPKKEKEQ